MTRDINRIFSVAPMLDWTDRHCRFFLRLISRHTLLYSEMVTTGALIYGERHRYLQFNKGEHPLALQLGGSDPAELADCSKMVEDYGYDEINLNVGCPSDRVQSGQFGACLMAEPERVRDCLGSMQKAVDIPVTVKHRIGIDQDDSYEQLLNFVDIVKQSGITTFIIHARKAWLDGLSPRENRDVPPLRYEVVHDLKKENPGLEIIINGGINTLDEAAEHLKQVDGVMMGRAIYHNPWLLADVDRLFFDEDNPASDQHEVIELLTAYIEQQLAEGARLNHISRHILGLFQGVPGAKAWRRYISENAHQPGAGADVITTAASLVTRQ
ncbi:MAG: tRNA dihydrouridine(20/20a) synthase DusA [Gammaproteobacteria bacterium]|nr:tRNA dihydrouridine(20/20a) synthase DusA [Gammaproteobacteria bacterium]